MVWQMFTLVTPVIPGDFCLGRSFFPGFKPLGLQAEFGTRDPALPMAGRQLKSGSFCWSQISWV